MEACGEQGVRGTAANTADEYYNQPARADLHFCHSDVRIMKAELVGAHSCPEPPDIGPWSWDCGSVDEPEPHEEQDVVQQPEQIDQEDVARQAVQLPESEPERSR